jgi:3-hydroxyacyl-[acyl-carrier-protein] dehydratase
MRFLLVDRILECPPTGPIRGLKHVAMSEDVLEHHFPGNPIMPGALLLEAVLQLAGWQVAARSDFAQWVLLSRVRRCAFYGFVRPGDTVALEVEPLGDAAPGCRAFRGTGSVDGARKIAVELVGELVPLEELEDPAHSRRMFAMLGGERSS